MVIVKNNRWHRKMIAPKYLHWKNKKLIDMQMKRYDVLILLHFNKNVIFPNPNFRPKPCSNPKSITYH